MEQQSRKCERVMPMTFDDFECARDNKLGEKGRQMRVPLGVVHGRFQPLHLGHLEYILEGQRRSDMLIVGITNPDPSQMLAEESAPERTVDGANPCTFYERYLMIDGAIRDAGVSPTAFRIVPFPISYPERLEFYAPKSATYFITIYDAWGHTKLKRLTELSLSTDVLWKRSAKVTTGTRVRRLLAEGGDWVRWVPDATRRVVEDYSIAERISDAFAPTTIGESSNAA